MKISVPEFEKRVSSGIIRKFAHPTQPLVGWCYTQKCQYDQLWDEQTIQARGIVTTPDGSVVSRPFPKFFNLTEKEAEPVPWADTIEITEKIDGSLIIVSFHNGEMVVNSKGSFTSEYAEFARSWLQENVPGWVSEGIRGSDKNAYTYLFEAVFPPTNQNEMKVINYGNRRDLTLLAVVEVATGKEYSYPQVADVATKHGFPVAPRYEFSDISDIGALITRCRARETVDDGEGVVLHFVETGKRVKVKSDVYLRLHKLISKANRRNILTMLMKGDNIEAIYAQLPDEVFTEVKKWITEYRDAFAEIRASVLDEIPNLQEMASRREQALYITQNPGLSEIKGLVFAALDRADLTPGIWGVIRKRAVGLNDEKQIIED